MKIHNAISNFVKEAITGTDTQAEKSKKRGALFAIAASVAAIAVIALSAFTVISTSLGVTSMLTGAGLLLGGFQVANAAANIFLVGAAAYIFYNCVKSAHYHLHNKQIQPIAPTLQELNQRLQDVFSTGNI